MRQHRRIEQGLIARIARAGGEAVRQRETRVSCQMGKEIAMRETLTYISGIERGVQNPSLKNIARIAKALGINLPHLLK